jgi:ketosteroid isomerase-like protein
VDAVNRDDREAVLEMMHPDIEWVPLRAGMTGAYHGHAGVEAWMRDNAETFEVFQLDVRDVRELGEDRVLNCGVVRIKALTGGVETTIHFAGIAELEDGLIKSWHDYGDAKLAEEAAR